MSEDYSSIDYQLSILQAAKEGKTIEVSGRDTSGMSRHDWAERRITSMPFNFVYNCYRVKKEPRKFNVWCKDGNLYSVLPGHDHKPWRDAGWELIEIVEVMK